MIELSDKNMSDLVVIYNGFADILGVPHEDTFKSLAVARAAVSTIEAKVNQMNSTTSGEVLVDPAAGNGAAPAEVTPTPAQRPLPTEEQILAAVTAAVQAGTDPDAAVKALMEGPPAKTEGNQKYNSSGKRGPNQGVGSFAKEQILNGFSNADVLKMVQEQFPTAKTSVSCIAFYRTALKKGTGGVAGTAKQASPTEMREQALKLMEDADALEEAQRMQAEQEAEEAKVKAEQLAAAAEKAKEIVAKAQAARQAQQELIAAKVAEMQAQRAAMLEKAKAAAGITAAAVSDGSTQQDGGPTDAEQPAA